ncbi:MAG: diguanylate cyclase, partial [Candidatus Ratteibacteria bacterium]|nr:diguanylate cyclase [Candidatus Ratteibacteria bacterium]
RAIITRDNIISSVGFVSAVPYFDMQHYIEERQYRGIKEYSIFQTVEGKKIAIKKDVYYPIEYLVSNTHSLGELSIGFDMGSLPEAYSAINEAMSAGLPSSTIPFVSPTFPRYISVFIFNKVSSSMQQGFVLSEIKLNFAVSPGAEIKILNNNIGVNFYYLDLTRDDVTKKHLFSIDYRQKEKTKNERFSISLPLFFAGQTYALSISGENLLGQGNIKGWLIISVAGFLLTLTLTFIICYFTTRQIVLEKEVSLRTLELRHQIQFEKFVADVSSILWRITRIDSQFNITSILKMVGEFADVDRSYIYLLSEDGITLSLVYEWCRDGIEAQEMFFQQIPLNMFSTLRTYLLNNRIIEIQDIDSLVVGRDITEIEKDKLKREGVVSVLAIPMVWEGKVIGCMGFDVVNRKKEWGDTCHTLLKIIAGQITGIIMKLKAEEKIWYFSSHDVLTGLYNRAYLEEEMKRLDTPRQLPISIIMGDLNNLKQINDIYGHSAGDEVLQKVSEVLRISCRKEDIIARWGGDEFVILLSQTDVKTVMTICSRIIENCKDVYVKGQRVSIAIGCSTKEDIEKDLAVVLKEAEEKMYKHKSIVKGNREA